METLWIIYALLSAIFAALVAIFGKIGVRDVDSTLATSVRAFVMFIFLLLVILATKKYSEVNTIDKNSLLFIVLSGIAGAISWIFYFMALKFGPASKVATVDRTSLVFVMVFSALLLGEKVTITKSIGILLVVTGSILVII